MLQTSASLLYLASLATLAAVPTLLVAASVLHFFGAGEDPRRVLRRALLSLIAWALLSVGMVFASGIGLFLFSGTPSDREAGTTFLLVSGLVYLSIEYPMTRWVWRSSEQQRVR